MDKKDKINLALVSVIKAIAFFFVYFLAQMLVGFVLGLALAIASPDSDLNEIINSRAMEITLISNIISIFGCIFLMRLFKKKGAVESFDINTDFSRAGTISGLCLALGISGQFAIMLILSILPFPESWFQMHNESSQIILQSNMAMQIIAVAIVAPLAEEIIFRACIQGTLSQGLPKWASILIASVIFGLMHGSPLAIVYATALGILMGWLYAKFDSIIPSMIFHFGFNLTTLLISSETLFIVVFVFTAIFFACLGFLIKFARLQAEENKRKELEGDNNQGENDDDEAL